MQDFLNATQQTSFPSMQVASEISAQWFCLLFFSPVGAGASFLSARTVFAELFVTQNLGYILIPLLLLHLNWCYWNTIMTFPEMTANRKTTQDSDSPDNYNMSEEGLEELLLRLQMEELDQTKARSTGKRREGEVNDFDLALEIFQAELESLQTFRNDRRMVKSVATALMEDNAVITTLINQEEAARNDRNIDSQFSNNHKDVAQEKQIQLRKL